MQVVDIEKLYNSHMQQPLLEYAQHIAEKFKTVFHLLAEKTLTPKTISMIQISLYKINVNRVNSEINQPTIQRMHWALSRKTEHIVN